MMTDATGFRGEPHRGPVRPTVWLALALAVLVGGSLAHTLWADSTVERNPLYRGAHAWGSDDAYITYRYARNFFDGHGLVFNPGDRVEGYTSLAYTLLMSVTFWATDEAGIYKWSVSLKLSCSIAALLLFHRIARDWLGPTGASVAAVLFGATPSTWSWTASGLETSMVLLLQLVLWFGVERATRRRSGSLWLLCLGGAALALSRADGFVFVAIASGYLAVRRCWLSAIGCAVACVFTVAGNVLWRLDYYGYPLPNTYYAKVAGPPVKRAGEGVKRLLSIGFHHYPALAFSLGVLSFSGLWAVRRRTTSRWSDIVDDIPFHLAMMPPLLCYWIWIGGDYFGDRFLLILYPAAIVASLRMIAMLPAPARAALTAVLLALQLSPVLRSPMFTYRLDKYDYWLELAPYLTARHSSPILAIDAAGKVPFITAWRTIDMLGLNDAFIGHKTIEAFETPGHDKYDADYVLSKKPDVIAAWIDRDGDTQHGMDRDKYMTAGYQLNYVMNAGLRRRTENVVDVSALDSSEIPTLFDSGYVYGVLARRTPSMSR